jgi:hypothetical protein
MEFRISSEGDWLGLRKLPFRSNIAQPKVASLPAVFSENQHGHAYTNHCVHEDAEWEQATSVGSDPEGLRQSAEANNSGNQRQG